MATRISTNPDILTLINVFTVAPENQQQLADTLAETTEMLVRGTRGFISASVHKSTDGTRVVNYAQWSDAAAFGALMQRQDMKDRIQLALRLGQPDGHTYTVTATIDAPEPKAS